MVDVKTKDETPPDWIFQLVKDLRSTISNEDPLDWATTLDEDGKTWYVEIMPTLFDGADGYFFRTYHVHVNPLLKLFTQSNITADPECLGITGKYKGHKVNVVILLHPEHDEDEEAEEADEPMEKSLLN